MSSNELYRFFEIMTILRLISKKLLNAARHAWELLIVKKACVLAMVS